MKKSEFEKQIKNVLGTTDNLIIGVATSIITDPKYVIPVVDSTIQYAVKLFSERNLFIVWDLEWRRSKTGYTGSSLSLCNNSWDGISTRKTDISCQYKALEYQHSGKWEKIYIVGLDNLQRFFENIKEYMRFNTADDSFPQCDKAKEEDTFDTTTREKYSSTRWKRDNKFRESVLSAYNYECAICRCDLIDILQAAHEHGYEPRSTSWDDPKHGFCLCANHHLMYDRNIIDFDLKSKSLTILDDKIKSMSWYREFVESFGSKLKSPSYDK